MLDEFGIGTSPILLKMWKGVRRYRNKEKKLIMARRDAYIIYIHPDDYRSFLEIVGTSIERKRHLIEFSTKIAKYCMAGYRGRDDLWMTCEKPQRGVGKRIMSMEREAETSSNS